MSIHKDHRQRVKSRFMQEGFENFDDLHVLEMMLFYCIPRRDTNVLAHNLLDHFGSLPDVIDATPEELQKVEGIGEAATTFICFLREFARTCEVRRNRNIQIINSYADIRNCLKGVMDRQRNEMVYIICLDAKRKVLCVKKVGEGDVNSAGVPVRKIVEIAIAKNASTVILAHNHPSGMAMPSQDDINATVELAKALRLVGVELADHVILADGDYVSLQQSGSYYPGMDRNV